MKNVNPKPIPLSYSSILVNETIFLSALLKSTISITDLPASTLAIFQRGEDFYTFKLFFYFGFSYLTLYLLLNHTKFIWSKE